MENAPSQQLARRAGTAIGAMVAFYTVAGVYDRFSFEGACFAAMASASASGAYTTSRNKIAGAHLKDRGWPILSSIAAGVCSSLLGGLVRDVGLFCAFGNRPALMDSPTMIIPALIGAVLGVAASRRRPSGAIKTAIDAGDNCAAGVCSVLGTALAQRFDLPLDPVTLAGTVLFSLITAFVGGWLRQSLIDNRKVVVSAYDLSVVGIAAGSHCMAAPWLATYELSALSLWPITTTLVWLALSVRKSR